MPRFTLILAALLTAAMPLMADDAPATQPADKPEEKQETQKADEKKKAPAKPVAIDKAEDVWQLFPYKLRPPTGGKVNEKLAGEIEAWLKENGGKIEGEVVFVADKRTQRGETYVFSKQIEDKNLELKVVAPIDRAEYSKALKQPTPDKRSRVIYLKSTVKLVSFDFENSKAILSVDGENAKIHSVKFVYFGL